VRDWDEMGGGARSSALGRARALQEEAKGARNWGGEGAQDGAEGEAKERGGKGAKGGAGEAKKDGAGREAQDGAGEEAQDGAKGEAKEDSPETGILPRSSTWGGDVGSRTLLLDAVQIGVGREVPSASDLPARAPETRICGGEGRALRAGPRCSACTVFPFAWPGVSFGHTTRYVFCS